ncbi:MAG: hypothetical protein CUN56_09255 [Phototrophicales bacterium]|nr:MAG: hypothetical protein CUN56_09255 [Phototrophicales bacterium]RMG74754.1 MAG: LysM peptidoglycan-binding domain-containing protein [Chloroflexota bacterium]
MKRLIFLVFIFVVILPVEGQDVANELLGRINGLRASLGLHPYTLNGALTAAAQNQANWMVETGQISHTQANGSTPRTRAQAAGYASSWVSENIYMGNYATVDAAWQFWLNSPIHYQGITSDHYYDIGIASATGNGRTAFVLVFGNPSTSVRVAPPITVPQSDPYNYLGNGSTADVNAVPPPPSFIVGVDENGNIMHEVQPGDTLGDILLIYGYTWDDIQRIRDLNGFTEEEGRNLAIGQIVLIPPWDAPETTPLAETTEEPAAGVANLAQPSSSETAATETPFIAITVIPSPTPSNEVAIPQSEITETPVWSAATFTPQAPQPTALLSPTVTSTSPIISSTATPTPTPFTQRPSSTPQVVAQAVNNPPTTNSGLIEPAVINIPQTSEDGDNRIALLAIALIAQSGLLALAGFEFWRRGSQ